MAKSKKVQQTNERRVALPNGWPEPREDALIGKQWTELVGAIDEDIRADTQYRDQEVRENTGRKTFDIDKVEFEEVKGDNGGEDDHSEGHQEDPGF